MVRSIVSGATHPSVMALFRLKGGWPIIFTCCYTGWRRPLSQPLSPAQTATQHCWASGHRAGRCTCSCTSLPSTFFPHTSVLAVSCNAGTQRVSPRVYSIHLYVVKASFCCSILKHNLKTYSSLLCRKLQWEPQIKTGKHPK